MSGRLLVRLLAAVVAVAALVWIAAALMVAPGLQHAVTVGVVGAAVWQALVLGVTFTALSHNRLAAFGVGMLARFLLVALTALVALPALKLPPAPLLLSMVTVLFATSLIEPVLFAAGARNETGR